MNETQLRRFVRKVIRERLSRQRKKLSLTDLLFEQATAAKMDKDRFPMTLSAVVGSGDADKDVEGGKEEHDKNAKDDVIGVSGDSPPVTSLKPSQTSMNIKKALAFALGMIKDDNPGGKLGAFISNDDHIMDGHHRWIASAMVDPSSKLGGSRVDFPATELIAVLNALTVGKFGVETGKPATGGFDQFKEGPIRTQLEDYLENGSGDITDVETGEPNPYRLEPEQVLELVEKFSGKEGDEAKEATIKTFVDNIGQLDFTLPKNAPSREDMPVIDKDNNQAAQTALAQGEVDVNPPYAEEEVEEGSRSRITDDLVMERWQRLAGLLKG
jgi:hypothetical protein